jgi:hypothetical protein
MTGEAMSLDDRRSDEFRWQEKRWKDRGVERRRTGRWEGSVREEIREEMRRRFQNDRCEGKIFSEKQIELVDNEIENVDEMRVEMRVTGGGEMMGSV